LLFFACAARTPHRRHLANRGHSNEGIGVTPEGLLVSLPSLLLADDRDILLV
jgi:hypothetical protein